MCHWVSLSSRYDSLLFSLLICKVILPSIMFALSRSEDYELWLPAVSSIAKKAPIPKVPSTDTDQVSEKTGSASADTISIAPRERLPSGESLPGADRRQMLKSRLSSVKDQTKSKMGAAVQTAKESQRGGRLMAKMAEAKATANAKLGEAATAVRTASDVSSTSGSGALSAGEKRLGRMSKIGTQVKSVKLPDGARVEKVTQAMKSKVKLDSQALSRLNSSTFSQPHPSFRNSRASSVGGASEVGQPVTQPALRITSLRALPSAPTAKQSDLPVVQLKRIPGKWNVKVNMVRVVTDEAIVADTEETHQESASIAKVEDNVLGESDFAGAENIESQPMPFSWSYEVVVEALKTHHSQPEKTTHAKTFEDVLQFYADISRSINTVHGFDAEYSLDVQSARNSIDFAIVDAALRNQLAVVSRVLEILLELNEEILNSEDVRSYQCETIGAFFNALFSSSLPEEAIAATANFFDLSRESGVDFSYCLDRYEYNASPATNVDTVAESPSIENIHHIISQCQTELANAARTTLIASSLASSMPNVLSTDKDRSEAHLSLSSRSGDKKDVLQEAMHKALVAAMTERDEAHAQLVASSVLHVHEMESERKKNDRLTRKLVVAEKLNAEASAGGSFFLGSDEVAQKHNISANSNVIQSSDDELLHMCRQLSSEIESKTAASLEIVRWKEGLKIEREAEKTRRDEMQQEIDALKEQVALERSKRQETEKERNNWQHSFHKAVSSGGDNADNGQMNGESSNN